MKKSTDRLWKRFGQRMIRILPHVTIVLSAMFITFWILDIYNPRMDFLSSELSKVLLMIFCIVSLLTAIVAVILDRRSDR